MQACARSAARRGKELILAGERRWGVLCPWQPGLGAPWFTGQGARSLCDQPAILASPPGSRLSGKRELQRAPLCPQHSRTFPPLLPTVWVMWMREPHFIDADSEAHEGYAAAQLLTGQRDPPESIPTS